MAVKFQYNKIALQGLNKQLNLRLKALPTLKNKEMALRLEVSKSKKMFNELDEKMNRKMAEYSRQPGIWAEFLPDMISLGEVRTLTRAVAGVKTPELEEIVFKVDDFSLFSSPKWFPEGVMRVKELVSIAIERDFFYRKMELLNQARRRTTQKVNLYEKVQIPEYEHAIRKIKRFLEDEENLSKSAQKIIKKRQMQEAEIES